jgi:hypothetical protein
LSRTDILDKRRDERPIDLRHAVGATLHLLDCLRSGEAVERPLLEAFLPSVEGELAVDRGGHPVR